MTTYPTMPEGELRRHKRSTTLKSGNIVFRDGTCVVPCRIKDTSVSGARLELRLWHDLPDQFKLAVPMGETHECQVVWRKNLEVGVRYVDREEPIAEATNREETGAQLLKRVDSVMHLIDELRSEMDLIKKEIQSQL